MQLHELPTPAAVIDLDVMTQNTARMARRAHRLGVKLRPHVKTHKCIEAARHQIDDHFGGITVSTLAEAEQFADAGFDDITYAVPLAPSRVGRALRLGSRLTDFQVLVDHPVTVSALTEEAAAQNAEVGVMIKVDCGYHRAGVTPDDPMLVQIARALGDAPGLRLLGVLAHAGHSYDCKDSAAIVAVAETERAESVRAAEILRSAGVPIAVVSVGSTPTTTLVEDLTGVTEVRPGNYALFDVFQATIGVCSIDDVALSVVSEVIGVYPERRTLLIDAGALAMSKDPGPLHAAEGGGFGVICGLDGNPIDGLSLTGLSQEHGKVSIEANYKGRLPSIGHRVRILPNHSCLVTALHDPLYVVHGETVVDEWRPVRGW